MQTLVALLLFDGVPEEPVYELSPWTMTDQELARYDDRVAELAGDAELVTWIHEGWLAGTATAD